MSSILTNNGAMVALQTLKSVNAGLSKTQDQISTGKNVATAKDNAAVWAISKVMESDVEGFKSISDSLNLGESTVATARSAAEAVTKSLTQIKKLVVSAQQASTSDRATIQAEIDKNTDQIGQIVSSAQFNGVNLIDGTSTEDLAILASLDRGATTVEASVINVKRVDLAVDGGLADLGTLSVADSTGATEALEMIETLIQTSIGAAASLGSSQTRISNQNEFVGKLVDLMQSGIGSLVDANMEEASARLQALQVQQQLATQSLSIANQAPQQLLSLFR